MMFWLFYWVRFRIVVLIFGLGVCIFRVVFFLFVCMIGMMIFVLLDWFGLL